MTFPTREDIEFFSQPEVAEFFGERWKPKVGDYYWDNEDKEVHLIGSFSQAGRVREWLSQPWCGFIPLFTVGQLIEMLEEKGYGILWLRSLPNNDTETRFWEAEMARKETGGHLLLAIEGTWQAQGPTPAIALAKCAMENLEEYLAVELKRGGSDEQPERDIRSLG